MERLLDVVELFTHRRELSNVNGFNLHAVRERGPVGTRVWAIQAEEILVHFAVYTGAYYAHRTLEMEEAE